MAVVFNKSAKISRYKDLDLNFASHPITGDITALTGETAIKRSLKNLVLLNFYEVPFNPEIGSEVTGLLFENFTPVTEINIQEAITRIISQYEPRAEIEQVLVDSNVDNSSISVKIVFFIVNQPEPVTVDIVLERTK